MSEVITKLCKKCNEEKPLEEMVKDKEKQDGYRHECKECKNKKGREKTQNDPEHREKERLRGQSKYQRDKEKHKEITARYRKENLPKYKNNHLTKTYGITLDDKNKMRDDQDNKCAICHIEFKDDKSAYVDHCHQSDKVRGLLCLHCNSGLGYFKDNIESLRTAIEYLIKHSL